MHEHEFELSVCSDMVLVYKAKDEPPLSISIFKDYPSREIAIRCAIVRAAIEELQQRDHIGQKPANQINR
jgi:hypothetical protein